MSHKLLLLDGNSLVSAAFYGIPPLSTSKGEPTNALYGFINSLFKLLEDFPTHAGVVFDEGRSFRKDMSARYKANRKATPEELVTQFTGKRISNLYKHTFLF